MSAGDSGAQPHRNELAADIAALECDIRLLQEIRDGLASQPGSDVMVQAVTGLIEERRADMERSRHLS